MLAFPLIVVWPHLKYLARLWLGTALKPHSTLPITKISENVSKRTGLKSLTEQTEEAGMAKTPAGTSMIKAGLLTGSLKDNMYYFPFQHNSYAYYTEESEKATNRESLSALCGCGFGFVLVGLFGVFLFLTIGIFRPQKYPLFLSDVQIPLVLSHHSTFLLVLCYQEVIYSHLRI